LHHQGHQRPAQPGVPVLRHPRRGAGLMLAGPPIDPRNAQDLVDEAKRRIPLYCPEWTDHNVSDPGVTLIELFAFMTDVLLYRLNRVTDQDYMKFLELIGARP